MLLWLAELLAKDVRAFNVFGYLTLRAVLACMTALLISFVVGPRMIAWLTRMKIGQSVRDDGPQTHLIKAGTPTMGGALILISLGVSTLLWADLSNLFIWFVLIVTFRSLVVAWLPLVSALTGVALAITLIFLSTAFEGGRHGRRRGVLEARP